MLKKFFKKVFPGVSWQNPSLNLVFQALDPIDYLVRSMRGLSHLPSYSIRVRSNGVSKQFGGKSFKRYGNQLAEHLKTYAGFNNESKVLEIGCGCGRTALALAKILNNGNFVGMDIEKKSLESCQNNPIFTCKKFRFDYLDVQNDEYNPQGKYSANTYQFPYPSEEFDVIFLVSVFTHMLTDDVKNYIAEISRMLKPRGICMITTFLMDKGRQTNNLSFPYSEDSHYFYDRSMPEVAIGYFLEFYQNNFANYGLKQVNKPLWGSWRNVPNVTSNSGFAQDIIFFKKEK